MAPLLPRMQVFEIADQEWCPQFLRSYIQAALTAAWTTYIPVLQSSSPARIVAQLLSRQLGHSVHNYTFIDFCAGGGGPTPSIEKHLNAAIKSSLPAAASSSGANYAAAVTAPPPVQFVLTDLHPHTELWSAAAAASPNLSYVKESVDASNVSPDLIDDLKKQGKKVFRLFNLAFHHFDDTMAKKILKNTLETSDGFGIFELQDRSLAGFLACCLFGLGTMVMAPYYAFLWGSPFALVWTYLIPALPAVLVFDGWMSSLRTRTPEEIKGLLNNCGVPHDEVRKWEVKNGKERFIPGVGYVNWVIVMKKPSQE
ncbi:hypothetical protein QBC40DRAFT_278092 [Triangularia verruculosa]|uniref:Uncharacterized protein n=1 Tax=Triangularia verruculosa TaxID=2587418 RepID=A0AAN7AW14_9PEZI|nr:hypothetical protein QBC40DRAFT_278092 [Triangularia verruculosa]